MKQRRLDGSLMDNTELHPEEPLPDKTCGMCSRKYRIDLGSRKVWKCDFKPRGWGYDILLKHPACGHFREDKGVK